MRRGVEAADVAHQLLFTAFTVVIHLGAVGFIQNVDVEPGIVARLFKEELNNPFAGESVHHLRELNVVGFHLHRQAMQLVV